MREFGHTGIIKQGFCLDAWGEGPFQIKVNGNEYLFEDSNRFGPLLLNKNHDVAKRQPLEKHPFFRGHWAWVEQGRKTTQSGDIHICQYEPLKPNVPHGYIKKGRRRIIVRKGWENGFDEPTFINIEDNFEPPTVGGEVI